MRRRLFLLALLPALAVLLWGAPAAAHTEFESSDPADGAVLEGPVDTVTAFLRAASGRLGGPDSCEMDTPEILGFSGCTAGSCPRAAAVSIAPMRAIRRPSSGLKLNPNRSASAIT